MDVFSIFTMFGGLALFLYGMHVMGEGLTKASGGRLEKILEKLEEDDDVTNVFHDMDIPDDYEEE